MRNIAPWSLVIGVGRGNLYLDKIAAIAHPMPVGGAPIGPPSDPSSKDGLGGRPRARHLRHHEAHEGTW
jgi:hypothetical protein